MTKTETKEHPILFSGEMVKAILDGRKTQTRRIVKPQPHDNQLEPFPDKSGNFWYWVTRGSKPTDFDSVVGELDCPYGVPGDRLWVRENYAVHFMYNDLPPSEINKQGWEEGDSLWYADGSEYPDPVTGSCDAAQRGKWRPSIHMPRWASRITLEVTDVRVERLQDISDSDATAEGVPYPVYSGREVPVYSGREVFRKLWDSINGTKHPWASNPWVWVVTFRRLD